MTTSIGDYIVDSDTQRLLDLTRTAERSEDSIEEIINIVNVMAPKLFEGLATCNKVAIAKALYLKCYDLDEVIFRQGDYPDAYYTVIRGAVSIYAHSIDAIDCNKPNDRSIKFGKFLVQLPPGASFGELSFNADYNHSRRNAGVISDGNHGQTRVVIQTGTVNAEGVHGEIEASNVAVLLLVPEKVYMEELFARHTAKHETKEKIQFLRASLLFKEWPMDELVKFAYSMRKRLYNEGSIVLSQGDRVDSVVIVKKGIVRIFHKTIQHKKSKLPFLDSRRGSIMSIPNPLRSVDVVVDIAEIGAHDLIGVVEVMTNSKKMRNEAVAQSQLEVFFIPNKIFMSFLKPKSATSIHLKRLVEKRIKWETLRRDYASKFGPVMPLSLVKTAVQMSRYHYLLCRDSISSDRELTMRNRKHKELFKIIREARSMLSKFDNKSDENIILLSRLIESKCSDAITLANEIGDKQRKAQVEGLMLNWKLKQQG